MPTIDTVTAWIVTEEDGGEGIPALQTDHGWMPMLGADSARIESFRPLALKLAGAAGLPLRLVRFSTRTVLEEHPPTEDCA